MNYTEEVSHTVEFVAWQKLDWNLMFRKEHLLLTKGHTEARFYITTEELNEVRAMKLV